MFAVLINSVHKFIVTHILQDRNLIWLSKKELGASQTFYYQKIFMEITISTQLVANFCTRKIPILLAHKIGVKTISLVKLSERGPMVHVAESSVNIVLMEILALRIYGYLRINIRISGRARIRDTARATRLGIRELEFQLVCGFNVTCLLYM